MTTETNKATTFGLKTLTVAIIETIFTNITDSKGNIVPDDVHHRSRASKLLHDNLIICISAARTKNRALKIIKSMHNKHMGLRCGE